MSDHHDLAELIWNTSRADEGTISATGANIVARAILDAGWRRNLDTQPAAEDTPWCDVCRAFHPEAGCE